MLLTLTLQEASAACCFAVAAIVRIQQITVLSTSRIIQLICIKAIYSLLILSNVITLLIA